MLDWHLCQICYPLEIKLLLLALKVGCKGSILHGHVNMITNAMIRPRG